MFNLQGSELVIILLLALVVLGPEKLPEAMRRMGRFYGELKKMSTGFQQEFRSAVDEPLRELRQTADVMRDSVDFERLQKGERDEKPKSAEMPDVSEGQRVEAAERAASESSNDGPAVAAEPLEAVLDDAGLREARPRTHGGETSEGIES